MPFSKDFLWGAATASVQVEGAAREDGKGESIWDVAMRKPGYVQDGSSPDPACDHYHRYREDIGIMKQIGLNSYRFSISWSRILPDGTGKINSKGLDFYDRLTDELLENGIEPFPTLFHWDYPYPLMQRGGWLNPDSPKWFAEYTKAVVEKLSDRIKSWFTINEPQCFIGHGYLTGRHAPGLALEPREGFAALHNCLLGHGLAVRTIREYSKQPAFIGMAPQGNVSYPFTETPENIEAARQRTFREGTTLMENAWWMDSVYFGVYPEKSLREIGADTSIVGPDDMKIISSPLDFFGCNMYNGAPTVMGKNGYETVPRPIGGPDNTCEWPVDFDILYWCGKFFYERYKLPVIVAENGIPLNDWIAFDGKVHDAGRIDFLLRGLNSFERAADEGIPLKGYFVWSFMDNMEWYRGFKKRFGIVYVDYQTQKRIIKDSGLWYAGRISEWKKLYGIKP